MSRPRLLLGMVLLLVSVTLLPAGSPQETVYTADLTGGHEVPPVETAAHGTATFILTPTGQALHYRLVVHDLKDVTMAHLHLGTPQENGEHVAWLYPPGPPPKEKPGITTGTLAEYTLTAVNLVGPMKGKTIADLVKEIEAGRVYVNVHTKAHPDGDIRGQVQLKKK